MSWRVVHPLGFFRSARQRVPHACALCKGGYHWEAPPTHAFGGIVPALAKSARMGHPPCWRFGQDQMPEPPAPIWDSGSENIISPLFSKLAKIENKPKGYFRLGNFGLGIRVGGGGGSRTRVRRCYWSRDYMLSRVPRAPSGPKALWGNHSPLALRTDKTREPLAR